MMRSRSLAFAAALLVFLLVLQVVSRVSGPTESADTLSPFAAVECLAFAIGFGAGLPNGLAVAVAIVVVLILPVATFMLVRRAARRFDRDA
jgi:ribose/xylose/arabinose/galactoside ABC-type transport system permease subunit